MIHWGFFIVNIILLLGIIFGGRYVIRSIKKLLEKSIMLEANTTIELKNEIHNFEERLLNGIIRFDDGILLNRQSLNESLEKFSIQNLKNREILIKDFDLLEANMKKFEEQNMMNRIILQEGLEKIIKENADRECIKRLEEREKKVK